jgi:two-component system NtrC family sensor kinase
MGVSLLVGVISLVVGSQLLYNTVLNEAKARISFDLNAAREIYLAQVKNIQTALSIASFDGEILSAFNARDLQTLNGKLKSISRQTGLEFAGIVTSDGKILCRTGPHSEPKARGSVPNPIGNYVIRKDKPIAGTVILHKEFLTEENPSLAEQARIKLLPTPMAAPRSAEEETSGMALAVGIPLYDHDRATLAGVLYGGILLNRNFEIVDRVRETVFKDETYKGRSIGTATIFFKDLRISTNVLNPQGERAIGTRVSKEVGDRVLINGERWTDRAFVVNDWFITAYEPIVDIYGERVGILYVGVLEEKYIDMRRHLFSIFFFITLAGMIFAIALGLLMASKIMRPLRQLIHASNEVSKGNLKPSIGPVSKSEIGVLQNTFLQMLSFLQERDNRQRAESETKLLQSEKQASVGRLAAGVAHEINNPLTGVLTFTHMLLRRKDINEEIRSDLQTIARETERVRAIVKGLLDFSRQTKLQAEPTDINMLVKSTIALVANQALVKGIALKFIPAEGRPLRTVDHNQLQSVLLNIIMNALDATAPGGRIAVTTGFAVSMSKTGKKGIEISVQDTGSGIPSENLDKLFDPFFTTKQVGQGTGLGLAVSYGIVERHGGSIFVESEVGKGSTFTIWLPLEGESER